MVGNLWVRLPSDWIDKQGLRQLSWKHGGIGADNTAALMLLTAIGHTTDQDTGESRCTYDDLCAATGLSRAKISKGLTVLKQLAVLEEGPGRSAYRLANFGPGHHWAKLPTKSMYSAAGRITAYAHFRLRQQIELDAMKLFFLFLARRSRDSNRAIIGYDKIQEYTGIHRERINSATSLLVTNQLIITESTTSTADDRYIANAYRIVGLDPYNHRGTRGRGMTALDVQSNDNGSVVTNEPVDYGPHL